VVDQNNVRRTITKYLAGDLVGTLTILFMLVHAFMWTRLKVVISCLELAFLDLWYMEGSYMAGTRRKSPFIEKKKKKKWNFQRIVIHIEY